MAAAPAEVLPPVKRRKRDTSCVEISTVFPAMETASGRPSLVFPTTTEETAGWCSLPDDLVRRIADSLLITNDIDCYTDFRAVCSSWRAATDDPKIISTSDPRFRPRTWIVLDEVFQQAGDDRRRIILLLNTATGRFLGKKLPLPLDYYVVATTSGGSLVLADRSPPHAARVFNPLTGHMVRLKAPVPPEVGVALVGSCDKTSSLALVLLGDSSCNIYAADPDSEAFVSQGNHQGVYKFFRKAVVGGAYPHLNRPAFNGAFHELCNLLLSPPVGDFVKFFSSDPPEDANDIRCFLVSLSIYLVLIVKTHETLYVFNMNTEIGRIEHVVSIAECVIFIGHHRCLPVNADVFPGIEANCVYYTEHLGSSAHICKYNIKDKKVERISDAAEFVKQDKKFVLVADRPFTIIQLLCSYTINIPDSQLALQQMS